MGIRESIAARRSVRTFDGRALTPEDRERILGLCREAENPFGIGIEWVLLDAEEKKFSSPVITGCGTFIAGKMARVPGAEEAFGFSFEEILLGAWAGGIGSTMIAGTMDRKAFERAAGLAEGEVMPCISPLGYAAAKMSLRETLMRRGVGADARLPFGKLFFEESFDRPFDREKNTSFGELLECIRKAPSAVNKQPWRVVVCGNVFHFYEQRTPGYVDASGWDLQRVDMGIAMAHLCLPAREEGYACTLLREDPGLAASGDMSYIGSFVLDR